MTNAIEFTGATKSFGQVLAVDDLTAVAQPGEVTALLGPNGAGKTTTLRMLLGLVASSSGPRRSAACDTTSCQTRLRSMP